MQKQEYTRQRRPYRFVLDEFYFPYFELPGWSGDFQREDTLLIAIRAVPRDSQDAGGEEQHLSLLVEVEDIHHTADTCEIHIAPLFVGGLSRVCAGGVVSELLVAIDGKPAGDEVDQLLATQRKGEDKRAMTIWRSPEKAGGDRLWHFKEDGREWLITRVGIWDSKYRQPLWGVLVDRPGEESLSNPAEVKLEISPASTQIYVLVQTDMSGENVTTATKVIGATRSFDLAVEQAKEAAYNLQEQTLQELGNRDTFAVVRFNHEPGDAQEQAQGELYFCRVDSEDCPFWKITVLAVNLNEG